MAGRRSEFDRCAAYSRRTEEILALAEMLGQTLLLADGRGISIPQRENRTLVAIRDS
jgi:hypothetical protein